VKGLPAHVIKLAKAQAACDDLLARHRAAQQKSRRQLPLERKAEATQLLVHAARKVSVRITRVSPREYDDDNLSGGCKQLRDAIATALGFPGDSRKDGMRWEYVQKQGPPETIVEVYDDDDATGG